MSEFLYVVRNWKDHFEIAESIQRKHLRWLATPVKHDGLGYRRMMAQRDGPALFGAWNAIIQTAAKAGSHELRGRLERDGLPLDAESLALMTCFPVQTMERALKFFSDPRQGWLDKLPLGTGAMPADSTTRAPNATTRTDLELPPQPPTPNGSHFPDSSGRDPDHVRTCPPTGQTEQDIQHTTARARAGEGWLDLAVENEASRTLPANLDTREFRDAWRRWVRHLYGRKSAGRRPSLQTFDAHIGTLAKLGGPDAVRAIDHAISMDWACPELPSRDRGDGAPKDKFASLGALQMRRDEIDNDIRAILYPGGCAFPQEPREGSREAARLRELREQRAAIKGRIETFGRGAA